MEKDYGREARKQYFKYFRFWFIIIGVLALVLAVVAGIQAATSNVSRGNTSAPTERVYDLADVLTDAEEERLRSQIAEVEKKIHMDIVIVTFSQSVEGREAMEEYNYSSPYWEDNMEALADDIWDSNGYGYNKSFEGDGVLLLHNWYEDANGSQNGEHMSTSGRAERRLSSYDIDNILYNVDRYYDTDPYKAYSKFVDALETYLGGSSQGRDLLSWPLVIFAPIVVAVIYAMMNLSQAKAKDTTTAKTYVADLPGGKPLVTNQRDDFIRKSVVTRHIDRSSSGSSRSGGGGGHSGGGGHHHSRSGASHGGGSHRH